MATITNNNRNSNSFYKGTNRNIVPGKVKRIILDGSTQEAAEWGGYDAVGLIYFTKIKQKNVSKEKTNSNEKVEIPYWDGVAKPLFPFLKYYPLVNEIVPIITLTGKDHLESPSADSAEQHYYFPPINLWNHPHHNTLPALENYNENNKLGEIRKNENYAQAGLLRRTTDGELDYEVPLGEYFNEQLNIKPLRPYEGDHIVEGRFGNSLRFGATARDKSIPISQSNNWSTGAKGNIGDPITILRNGQAEGLDEMGWVPTVEDINLDASSIYLTSNQKIDNLIIAAPDCWYSFGLNADIPQDPNQEAKKFLDSPVDFIQSDDEEPPTELTTEETTDRGLQDTDGTLNETETQPESITEDEAGLNEEKIEEPQQYQQENELEEVEYVDPNLPSSYQIYSQNDDSPMGYGEQCGQCAFFSGYANKQCGKWSAIVKPTFWCQSFKAKGPYDNIIGKYYEGTGKAENYSLAETLAKQNALTKVYSAVSNTNVNVVFGESFQPDSPLRYPDGELEVYISYKVKSIS